ncbi:MAG: MoxR family ATPase [Elusimicrobia bacterium]|nr:MoxR family ATPase [Elusimicrobiota bacterium]
MKTKTLERTETLLAMLVAAALVSPTPAAAQAMRTAAPAARTGLSGVGAAGSVTVSPSAASLAPTAPGLAPVLPSASVSLPQVSPTARPAAAAPAQAGGLPARASAAAPAAAPVTVNGARAAKALSASASPIGEVLSGMPEASKAAPSASFSAGVSLEDAMTRRGSRAGSDAVVPIPPRTMRGSLLARPNGALNAVGTEDWVPLAQAVPAPRPGGALALAAAATKDMLGTTAGKLALLGLGAAVGLLALHAYLPAAVASLSLLLMSGTLARTPAPEAAPEDAALTAEVKEVSGLIGKLRAEVGNVIVGQQEMVDSIIMAMIANEHLLLEGVPGVAKTATIKTFAAATGADFQVIQGTPDKMPADILGAEILQTDQATGQRVMKLEKGPIFAQFVLADEINRMMPKTQAALLQAMQDRMVSIGRETLPLPKPFLMLATMNPLEQEGVNVMPEAQLDRFMFKVIVPQPNREDRKRINEINRKREKPKASKVVSLEDLERATALAERVALSAGMSEYIQDILDAAQDPFKYGVGQKGLVEQAMVTRASIMMEKAARIQALMNGRSFVTAEDVMKVAPKILRHRIILSYAAGEMTTDQLIAEILSTLKIPS